MDSLLYFCNLLAKDFWESRYLFKYSQNVDSVRWELLISWNDSALSLVSPSQDKDGPESYFAPDCFHFGAKGHATLAKELWNNMVSFTSMEQHVEILEENRPLRGCLAPYFKSPR